MQESQEPDHTTAGVPGAPPAKKMKGLGAILKRIVNERSSEHVSTHPRSPHEVVQKETSQYLDLPDLDPDKDPLNWWKDEVKHLPILGRLARNYLCACAMSVPLERVFSKAGYIANHFRARLSTENVNKLVFLSKNL